MNKNTYIACPVIASNSRRGWSLILLLFISASLIAVLPAIMSHLDTSAKSSTAFERWTQLQRAEDMVHLVGPEGRTQTKKINFGLNQVFEITLQPEKFSDGQKIFWRMNVSSTVNGHASGFAISSFVVELPGDGSPEHPFVVASVADLEKLRNNPDEYTHFVIAANIEFPSDPDFTWTPIGTRANPFKGTVKTFQDENGEYFTISGMRIVPDSPGERLFGFFGAVNGAKIENVHLKNVNIDSRSISNAHTGPLVALAENGTQIIGCFASGDVKGESNVGGLVGSSLSSSIINSHSTTRVGVEMPAPPANNYVPVVNPVIGEIFASLSGSGLAGAFRASVKAASANDSPDSQPAVMGSTIIRASVIAAPNTPVGENIGGLVGYTNGTVTGSAAYGNVSGVKQVGGLIGYAGTGAVVTRSLATGNVTASNQNSGGLIGLADGASVNACLAKGSVAGAMLNIGGFIGRSNNSTISNSIASGNVSGDGNYLGGLVGYSLTTDVTNSFATGAVTSGQFYYPAGGLIGEMSGGLVSRSFASGNVSSFISGGGLAGILGTGRVEFSYSTGSVTAQFMVGGLIGSVNSGDVYSCYSTGSVSGGPFLGGLVGNNNGKIEICYSHSSVIGSDIVGGLVGANKSNGLIVRCYSIGPVTGTSQAGGLIGQNLNATGITRSYWNTETSGQATSAGGEAKNTYQMLNGTRNAIIDGQYIYRGWLNTDWHFNPTWEYPRLKKAHTHIMAEIPGGTFQRDANTGNLSTVSGFRMSIQEVTQQQYMAVTGLSNPSYIINPQFPVQGINWYAALVFCNRLSILEGLTPAYTISRSTNPNNWGTIPTVQTAAWDDATCNWKANGYRLATEDEYHWASMGAQNNYLKAFSGSNGSNSINDYAWYFANTGSNVQQTAVLLPNELGLYDMSGNMWDMVWDRSAAPANGARTDFTGPTTGTDRIVRGGDFTRDASWQAVSSSIRYLPPAGIYSNVGFRVVRRP